MTVCVCVCVLLYTNFKTTEKKVLATTRHDLPRLAHRTQKYKNKKDIKNPILLIISFISRFKMLPVQLSNDKKRHRQHGLPRILLI